MRKSRQSDVEDEEVYNPLEKKHLGESIATALLRREPKPLPPPKRFFGAGIYAIYYLGDFDAYTALAKKNKKEACSAPIYVGRAVRTGSRKGGESVSDEAGSELYDRLQHHAKSIAAAKNLTLAHFRCRYLVVEETFITLGESLLISWFAPLWNQVLDGFGNNAPGGNRGKQMRSPWDTLHPGRAWAETLSSHPKSASELKKEITKFLGTVRTARGEIHVPRASPTGKNLDTQDDD